MSKTSFINPNFLRTKKNVFKYCEAELKPKTLKFVENYFTDRLATPTGEHSRVK